MTDTPDASIIFRVATPDDAPALARLKVLCWRVAYQGLMPQTVLDNLDADTEAPHWRSWLEDPSSGLIACLIEKDDELIGYGLAGPMRLGDRPGKEIEADSELYALYIHPDFQRIGLGYRLTSVLVDALVKADYQSMGLWMVGGNLNAEAFYLKLHGTEAGKRVEIHNGRISFREKAWVWHSLKQLRARLTVRAVSS